MPVTPCTMIPILHCIANTPFTLCVKLYILTLLPQIRSSISSGQNNILSGLSLVTMWNPLLKALNCFSMALFRMNSV